jgi:hypothetical protein
MQPPVVWLAGDVDQADFAPAVAWLRSVGQCGERPTTIVLFQSRPGSVAQAEVERLHRQAPLARLVLIIGPWCAGEGRSGQPLHGVTRIAWHQWRERLPQELGIASAGCRKTAFRPRTWSDLDRLLGQLTPVLSRPTQSGLAAICTDSRESCSLLADACRAVGLRAVWQQPGTQEVGADVLLIDGWGAVAACNSPGASPCRHCVLLLPFPRHDDLERAHQHGIRAVLAKPVSLADLAAALDALRDTAANPALSQSAA